MKDRWDVNPPGLNRLSRVSEPQVALHAVAIVKLSNHGALDADKRYVMRYAALGVTVKTCEPQMYFHVDIAKN